MNFQDERDYFGWDNYGIGPDILYMVCSGVIIFTILLIKEMGYIDDFLYLIEKWRYYNFKYIQGSWFKW